MVGSSETGSQRDNDAIAIGQDDLAKRAEARGKAALTMLNDEADRWQRARSPELVGHYLTAIDYVKANIVHWKSPTVLKPKIEAAAHAYKCRSRLANLSSVATALLGVALGVTIKSLVKLNAGDTLVWIVLLGGGGASTLLTSAFLKPRFVVIHAERAKEWKAQLDAMTLAREKALEGKDADGKKGKRKPGREA